MVEPEAQAVVREYSLTKKRLRLSYWSRIAVSIPSVREYSLTKKRLRLACSTRSATISFRPGVFADEEAIETGDGLFVAPQVLQSPGVFADEEAIETFRGLTSPNTRSKSSGSIR